MRIGIPSWPWVAAMLLAASSAFAQSGPAPTGKVQERRDFDDLTRNYDKASPAPSGFKMQCTRVLGLDAYCGCLGKDMPAGVGFDNFVVVLTRTKQENGYDKLDATSKRAYDAIPVLRDRCATQAAKP